jgi:hypothetical protein
VLSPADTEPESLPADLAVGTSDPASRLSDADEFAADSPLYADDLSGESPLAGEQEEAVPAVDEMRP